jgi:hypothetical protein
MRAGKKYAYDRIALEISRVPSSLKQPRNVAVVELGPSTVRVLLLLRLQSSIVLKLLLDKRLSGVEVRLVRLDELAAGPEHVAEEEHNGNGNTEVAMHLLASSTERDQLFSFLTYPVTKVSTSNVVPSDLWTKAAKFLVKATRIQKNKAMQVPHMPTGDLYATSESAIPWAFLARRKKMCVIRIKIQVKRPASMIRTHDSYFILTL